MLRPLWRVPESLGTLITQPPDKSQEARGFQLHGLHVPVGSDNKITSQFLLQSRNLAELGHVFWATAIDVMYVVT